MIGYLTLKGAVVHLKYLKGKNQITQKYRALNYLAEASSCVPAFSLLFTVLTLTSGN